MNAERLRQRLTDKGVTLWADGEQLRFRAPKGVLTPDDLAELKAIKPAVLALLAAEDGVRPDPDARHEPFPLTDVQAAYLLGRTAAFGYGGLGCHSYFEVAFPALDPRRLDDAWHTVVTRHDMLRAVVHPDGYQRVLPDPPRYPIAVDDLRGMAPELAAATIADTRRRMSHKVYEPDRWPLFELRISRTGEHDLLHVSIDLLIADYTSVQIVLADLDAYYRDPDHRPAQPRIAFRDWVLAEQRHAGSPGTERDRDWWLRRLDTLPPAPALPVLPGSESTAPPRFRRLQASLDATAWAALRQRCAAADLTPACALLAAYAEVIGRWSAEPAFTLNLTLLGRTAEHPDVAGLVGDFTAVELLEVRPDPAATFAERAAALGDQLFADLDHRRFGGVRVLRELARRRGAAAALMPVVFTSTVGLASDEVGAGRLTGTGELGYGVTQTPQVWIDCQVMEYAGALRVHWDVRDGVFPDAMVEDMFAAYTGLLRRLAGTDQAWSQAAVGGAALSAAQRRRRAAVNATTAPIPDGTLHGGILAQAERSPERVAVLAGEHRATYRELAGLAAGLAGRLRADGCRPGEPVAILLDKGIHQIAAVLGVLMAGGAYLPVDPNQPAARRDAILRNAGVRQVVSGEWCPSTISHSQAGEAGNPDGLAYVIHTSGSTGTPKGVMVSHRAALNTIVDVNRRYGVGPGDAVLGVAALGFDLSVYDIFGPLSVGGRLVLPDPQRRGDPSHLARLVAEHGVTLWNSVPAQLQLLHDYLAANPGTELPTLRLALLSGDWIPVTLPDAIRALLPRLRLESLGGATEAAIWSIHHPITEVPPEWSSIPYGTPLANQSFHVLDAWLRPCPDHVPGELYIGGAGLAIGYLNDPAETAYRFVPHPQTGQRLYRTGDYGRYLPDGTIEFLGRRDTQVKIRGHRIELAEVEAAIGSHPAVGAAAVLAAGDAPLQRRLVAFATPASLAPAQTGTAHEVVAKAQAAAEATVSGVDVGAVADLADHLDQLALRAMMAALQASGVFTEPGRAHRADEVIAAARVAPRHHRLLRRWLAALAEHGMIVADGAGYRPAGDPGAYTPDLLRRRWQRVDELGRTISAGGTDYGAELIGYLRVSAERLPELLRGEADPLDLLFPEGRVEVAEGVYKDNVLSRYVNRALAATLSTIAAGHPPDRPLRVLEVGAGIGGTTVDLVEAADAAGTAVDYLFTDLSQFFLNRAAERFAGHSWLRYGLFDLNAGYRQQGLAPNSFDVVVCANVLHNARHAGQALQQLTELARPGGWLLFIEATRDSYPLMASMEFQEGLTDFTDERAATDRTFHTRDGWVAMLDELGAELVYCLPAADDPLSRGGQHAFAARVKPGRAALDVEALTAHLSQRLPSYMLPAELQIVDALPLTGNGKLDRKALHGWLLGGSGGAGTDTRSGTGSGTGVADVGAPPRDDLEERIAALWAGALGIPRVGRDRDFYALGGDSLLVAQVVGRMREHLPEAADVPWDTLLRRLVATPTVAAVADHLRREPATAETAPAPASPLVGLCTAAAGRPTVVLVHDGSGTIAPYQALITALRGSGPLVGLAVADRDGYLDTDPGALLELLATEYRDALLAAGHQRLHVVGYCMGGLLATELARQLTEIGAEVTGLTVISSYQVPFQVLDDVLAEYAFARVAGADPAALGFPADERALGAAARLALCDDPGELSTRGLAAAGRARPELAAVARAFTELARRPQPERLAAIAAASPLLDAERVEPVWRLFRHSLDAVTRLRPAPYAGDITFLRQLGDTPFLPGLRADMTTYWQQLCLGELRVHDIAGDHFSCLRQPHVSAVAELLRLAW